MPQKIVRLFDSDSLPEIATIEYDCERSYLDISSNVTFANQTSVKMGDNADDVLDLIKAAFDLAFTLVDDKTWTDNGIDQAKFKNSVDKLFNAMKDFLNNENVLNIRYGLFHTIKTMPCDAEAPNGRVKFYSVAFELRIESKLQASAKPFKISSVQTVAKRVGRAFIACECPKNVADDTAHFLGNDSIPIEYMATTADDPALAHNPRASEKPKPAPAKSKRRAPTTKTTRNKTGRGKSSKG